MQHVLHILAHFHLCWRNDKHMQAAPLGMYAATDRNQAVGPGVQTWTRPPLSYRDSYFFGSILSFFVAFLGLASVQGQHVLQIQMLLNHYSQRRPSQGFSEQGPSIWPPIPPPVH